MKMLKIIVLLCGVFFSWQSVHAEIKGPEIHGNWRYVMKIYKGQEMPEPPEATLRLFFEFLPDGTDRLYWWHEGENDLCDRSGQYKIENDILVDEVVWVNPANHFSCDRDPDMQKGRISRTPIQFIGDQMRFTLALGDEDLIYVWKRSDPQAVR